MRALVLVMLMVATGVAAAAPVDDDVAAEGGPDATDPALDDAGCEPPDDAAPVQPSVRAVVARAVSVAGFDHSPARGWSTRARLAGLVPAIGVRAGRNTRWEAYEPDVGYGTAYEVRATWRLDRLVFDGRELQAASIDAARRRERGRLSSRVIRLYFTWRRALRRAGSCALVAEQAAAELDALTGDWFTNATFDTSPIVRSSDDQ